MTEIQVSEGLGNPELKLVDSVATAQEFLRWLGQSRPLNAVSIDLETGEYPGRDKKGALSPWHGKIRLAQVGDSHTGWAIPWERWAGVFYQGMDHYEGPIIAHNIAFEAKWLAVNSDYLLPWDKAHDTMIMSQVIQPDSPTHALKSLTSRLIDPRASALQTFLDETMVKNGWTWGTIPTDFPIYWQYGALDTVITTRLFLDHFYKHVRPGAQLNRPYELEMANRRICTQMEINGARVDLEYSSRKYDELVSYTEKAKTMAMSRYGYNIGSPSQLARAIENLGGEITKRTRGGAPSVDKEQLDLLLRDGNKDVREIAQLVINVRKADKLASSYFLNFQKDAIDGILHPEIRTLEARTGRMSITNPALQTLPSGDPLVRRAFLPRTEDERIVSSDLDQVEFRLTANFSQDRALIDLFHEADRTGGDVFTSIMRQVYKDDTLQKSDPRRKLIKGCVPLTSTILTKRGWLTHAEVQEGDETIGYNLESGKSEWTKILGVHVFEDSDIYRLSNEHKSFYCTDDHRWVADNGRSGARASAPKIIHANQFIGGERRLILAAQAEDGTLPVSATEAALLGWVLGDGSIKRSEFTGGPSQGGGSRVGCQVRIFQTKPKGIETISALLVDVKHSLHVNQSTGQHVWTIDPDYARDLLQRAGIHTKTEFDPWKLSAGLTAEARDAMVEALDEADGKNKTPQRTRQKIDVSIVQATDSPVKELVVALGFLTGNYATETTYEPTEGGWAKKPYSVVRYGKGSMTNQRASLEYVETGSVWCVTTELGTWTMRQEHNKVPVLTGNTVYGKLYGAGVAKMAQTSKVSEEDMQMVVTAFDNTYPGIKKFQRQVEREGQERLDRTGTAYVETETGRMLPAEPDRLYALTNYKIQGTAAELFKHNLIKLDAAGLTEHMVVPVHDEIVLSMPQDMIRDAAPIIQESMTTSEGWEVPLTAGVDFENSRGEFFKTWGQIYEEDD